MRIGGWGRLWVVITILYGIVVAFIAYDVRPTFEQLQYNWVRDASDTIAEAISRTEKAAECRSDRFLNAGRYIRTLFGPTISLHMVGQNWIGINSLVGKRLVFLTIAD